MPASAQGPALQSPGASRYSTTGQIDRFSNEFNPAIGAALDFALDWSELEPGDSGLDASLRLLELNLSAYVDPKMWVYVVLTSHGGEAFEFEEAAVEYLGFESNKTLKAGLFFVDFGKQMQSHLEELRTLDRPAVLREFLGEELSGLGVQYDDWFTAGDETVVRFSLGAFRSLVDGGHVHGEGSGPVATTGERVDLDELHFTARVTGMSDVGENGQLQLGLSGRFAPEFGFDFDFEADDGSGPEELETTGLANVVSGIDLTYGWTDETGQAGGSVGGEFLAIDGDLSAAPTNVGNGLVGDEALAILDQSATGFYVYGDYAWDARNSAGVQYSAVELLEGPAGDRSELDLYYTHHFTEFRRLRFGVTLGDDDEGSDFERLYVQFTTFLGSHGHGLNW